MTEDVDMTYNVGEDERYDFEPASEVPKPIPTKITTNNTPTEVIVNLYSDKVMPIDIWQDVIDSYNWKGMPWHTHDQMMDLIIKDIEDPTPKQLTIACWGKLALKLDNSVILDSCNKILDMVNKKGIHQVSYATTDFPPDNQVLWPKLAKLNIALRILNIDRNIPPFPLHKATMKHLLDNNKGPLIVKGHMWVEFNQGTGLGTTISRKGYKSIKNFATRALENQFVAMERKPSRRNLVITQPPPLCTTDDYLTNPKMVELLKIKGEFSVRSLSSNSENTNRAEPPKRSASASNIDTKQISRPSSPKCHANEPFRPIVPQPGYASSQQAGASATPEERQMDLREELNRRDRTGSWYGKDLTVRYQAEQQKREVVLPHNTNNDAFEIEVVNVVDSKDKTNHNEMNNTEHKVIYTTKNQWPYTTNNKNNSDSSTKTKDNANKNKNDDIDAIKKDLKKAKQEIKKFKERETYFESKIKRINEYAENDEKTIKDLKNELSELKSDHEQLKVQQGGKTIKDLKDELSELKSDNKELEKHQEYSVMQAKLDLSRIVNLENTVDEQQLKISLLQNKYTFLKDIHDETMEMIKQQKELRKQ